MKTFQLGPVTALLLATATSFACGGSEGDYEAACDAQCACAPCSDAGLQACYDSGRAAYEDAVKKGCKDEAEADDACVAEHSVCEDGLPRLDDAHACDDVRIARSECTSH
jgi:hypothetical protein